MNEQEWLSCEEPAAMLDWLGGGNPLRAHCPIAVSDRKLRLFACACCRQVWHLLADERSRNAVEVAERFADGLATRDELGEANSVGTLAMNDSRAWGGPAATAAWVCVERAGEASREALGRVAPGGMGGSRYAALLRDVAGNPYRPVTLPGGPWVPTPIVRDESGKAVFVPTRTGYHAACPWLTPTVLTLAQQAYDERQPDGTLDPFRLAILSDCLEEAGCDSAELLTHLRSPGVHVRGCWAVDAVQGSKS